MAIIPNAISKVLNNGAQIKAFKQMIGRHMVVLAFLEHNVITPWVTWCVDDNGDAYWGHYFKTDEEAFEDWKERAEPKYRGWRGNRGIHGYLPG